MIIYYFTGTGNALSAANWIAQTAEIQNISAEIVKISPSLQVEKKENNSNELIGFCFPTHGFNAPPVVINFLIRFPKGKNKVFLLNTRAGMKLYKLFIPGISGLAELVPALILKMKGYRIAGMQPMDLPSNWISLHPGLRKKVINSIFERCERITKKFACKILSGQKIYKGIISLPIDLIVSPVSIAYYFYGRMSLSKTFIANYKCNNCMICVKECPVQAIVKRQNRPFWSRKCESCMHCMNRCPQKAIETPHLFVVVIWWVIFSFIPLTLLHIIAQNYPGVNSWSGLLSNLIILVTGLPFVFFTYSIMHFLMKYKFFNWLITNTSLTRLWFWRRYFAPQKYLTNRVKK